MGRKKHANQKQVPSSQAVTNNAASGNKTQTSDCKTKGHKTQHEGHQNGKTHAKTGAAQSASSRKKQSPDHGGTEGDLVNAMKQCKISDKAALKKEKEKEEVDLKKKSKKEEEDELQRLVDFIERKDPSKKKQKKKKTTACKQPVEENGAQNSDGSPLEKCTEQGGKEKDEKQGSKKKDGKSEDKKDGKSADKKDAKMEDNKKDGKSVDKKEGTNGKKEEGQKEKVNGTAEKSEGAQKTVKPCKKAQRKAGKAPNSEELEVERLLQFIEGNDKDKAANAAEICVPNDNDNKENNGELRQKKRKKKNGKEFDFDALKENTHLEAKMIEQILKTPEQVAQYRLFKPKQVAMFFSTGHTEHWEKHPDCDGKLESFEQLKSGQVRCNLGNRKLDEVIQELRAERGNNITKQNLIDALLCRAFLKCNKCIYRSNTFSLQ